MNAIRQHGNSQFLRLVTTCLLGGAVASGLAQDQKTSDLTPLTELGSAKYKNETGGLYGNGKNEPPAEHLAAARRETAKIQPLDKEGRPAADGKIVLLSMGMSNTSQVSQGFQRLLREDREVSPRVVFVNGAQGGMDAARWTDTMQTNPRSGKSVWDVVDDQLSQAGVTSRQVQVVWLKQALIQPSRLGEFPKHAEKLRDDIAKSLVVAKERFPNLRIVYLSSRTYGGHAKSNLNPEPFAFESAFPVRWLIESQIKKEAELNFDDDRGAVKVPLLLWGPYLWANGDTPRKTDGITWTLEDVADDGTHHSQNGQFKSGLQMLRFFKNDPLTRQWFVGSGRDGRTSSSGPSRPAIPNANREGRLFGLDQPGRRDDSLGDGPVKFSHFPMRLDDIGSICPMGLMVGGHVTPSDHLGIAPKVLNVDLDRYDVLAMADGVIVEVQRAPRGNPDPAVPQKFRDMEMYKVTMQHSATIWTYASLINKLEPFIIEAAGGEIPAGPPVRFRVPVKAGQVIGKFGGGHGIDFGVIDTAVTLKGFVVPERFRDRDPQKLSMVDPFDYVGDPLKSQLLALNPRKAAPRGGRIDYDIDGRLVGNWYKQGSGGYAAPRGRLDYWIGHLSIVYHHIDASQITVSIGDFGGQVRQYWVKGNAPDPAKVGVASGLVKYELVYAKIGSAGQTYEGIPTGVQGVLLVELVDDRTLRVEAFPGKFATDVAGFTEKAQTYER